MSIKKMVAAAITAAFVLLLTACAGNEKPSANGGGTGNTQSSGASVTSGTGNSGSASEPAEKLDIWNYMPEIPVTDASEFKYEYNEERDCIIVTDYLGKSSAIRIPGTFENKPVFDVSFYGCNAELTQIVMPDTVVYFSFSDHIKTALQYVNIPEKMTTIGDYAFADCPTLTSIYIPNSVTEIEGNAFDSCASLTSINIPSSVTEINKFAFNHTDNLASINVDPDNPVYCSIDGVLFSKDKTELKRFPNGKSNTYTIPDGVTVIGEGAFAHSPNLTSITIPSSVTQISNNAFRNCTNLTSVTIPSGVVEIGSFAFTDCTNLTSINIPSRSTKIGDHAFDYCPNLTKTYGDANTAN